MEEIKLEASFWGKIWIGGKSNELWVMDLCSNGISICPHFYIHMYIDTYIHNLFFPICIFKMWMIKEKTSHLSILCDRAKSGLGNQSQLEEKVSSRISMEFHKDSMNQTTAVQDTLGLSDPWLLIIWPLIFSSWPGSFKQGIYHNTRKCLKTISL